MKKKILGLSIFLVTVIAIAAFNLNVNSERNNFSELALANIEALAQNENGGREINCLKDPVSPTMEELKKNPSKYSVHEICSPCGTLVVLKSHGDSSKCKMEE